MSKIRPFQAFRPNSDLAAEVSCPPYDVISDEECRKELEDNPLTFLKIIRSEINFPKGANPYNDEVYLESRRQFDLMVENDVLIQDESPSLYIYKITWKEVEQYGLFCLGSVDDYASDVIKKHEYTRPVKEKDRIRHIELSGLHTGPVFMAYKNNVQVDRIISKFTSENEALYNFDASGDVQHKLWKVSDEEIVNSIVQIFDIDIAAIYIADGHHRAASSYKVAMKKREENNDWNIEDAYNHFPMVLFPDNQVKIIDYNRIIKSLNGLSKEEFISKMNDHFKIELKAAAYKPERSGEFGMYIDGQWYACKFDGDIPTNDPVASLDISVLQQYVFDELLNIKDQRTDDRIDFVGGIRGLSALEEKVDSGDFVLAFSIYPVSVAQLFAVADSGEVMPPKTTWFEPKLRSGMLTHKFD